VASGQLAVAPFATHHFGMNAIEQAYATFAQAADTKALKVVITK
jgi:alcohol dehydrogenase